MRQHEGRTFLRASITTTLIIIAVGAVMVLPRTVRSQLLALHSPSAVASTRANSSVKPSAQSGGDTALQTTGSPASCKPAVYKLPNSIDMTAMPEGVTTVTDSPQYYVITGSTTAAILSQMQACAPGGEYAGQSGYNISWYYGYAIEPSDRCVVVGAKIGLHLNMILPRWRFDAAAGSTAQEWARFSTALRTHEGGHQRISKTYAASMLRTLQTMSASSCSALKQKVQSSMHKILADLHDAQVAYDATTNHGQTQGAELR